MSHQHRLLRAIPGGAHTYSKGLDQFPANSPAVLSHGKGAYVFDLEGNSYLDYGLGLRSVTIGYAEDEIDDAAIKQLRMGNNLTRPSLIELQAAELMIDLIDSIEMVKFTKNGSTAVSAAVKLARAYTSRDLVARCADHPFFSYDDWFIASTPLTKGIPQDVQAKTLRFRFNDLASLEEHFHRNPEQIACVVLEPATTEHPQRDFLTRVQQLCTRNGALLIFDEMITGFRWHLKGAQHLYGIRPDLCTFGKAMANGHSVACVGGRRDIMQQGSIEFEGSERVFLLSTTHGAEMSSLGAFVAAVSFMRDQQVVDHLWTYGQQFIETFESAAERHGVSHSLKVGGISCSPYYLTLNEKGENCMYLRTLLMQEMLRHGVLLPSWVAICYRHGQTELALTRNALDQSLSTYRSALQDGPQKYLIGSPIKPVFRKFN